MIMTVTLVSRRTDHVIQHPLITLVHPNQYQIHSHLLRSNGETNSTSTGEDTIDEDYKGWYVISHDIENRRGFPLRDKLLLSAFCYNNQDVLVIDNTSVDNNEIFSKDLLSRCLFIAHNADHEATWGCTTDFLPMRYICTLVNDRRLYSGQIGYKFDIMSSIRRHLGIEYIPQWMDKDIRDTFEESTRFDAEQILYNAADTIVLKLLAKAQLDAAKELNQYFLHNTINSRIVKAIAKTEMTGIKHNSEEWIRIAKERETKATVLVQELNGLLLEKGLDLSLVNPEIRKKREQFEKKLLRNLERELKLSTLLRKYEASNKTHLKAYKIAHEQYEKVITTPELVEEGTGLINWGSQKQVLEVFRQLDIPIPENKDKKSFSLKEGLGKEARANWFVKYGSHPVMDKYDSYKRLMHNISSFGESWIQKYVKPNGRVYTTFKQSATETGRFASGDKKNGLFNIQQIPAREGKEYRECFVADPGRMFVTCDYSNAEGVIVIALSGDLKMKEITELKDQHSALGQAAWRAVYKHRYESTGKEEWRQLSESYEMNKSTPEKETERNIFKNSGGLFPCLYGVAASKVAAAAKISEKEGQVMIDTVKSFVPGAVTYLDTKQLEATTLGYVIHNKRSGSRRWFTPILDHIKYGFPVSKSEKVEIGMAGRNTAIQGTNSDAMKETIAMVDLWAVLFKQDVKLVLTNHDEGVWDVPEENCEWYAERISNLMCRAMQNYLIPEIKIKVDCKILKTWTK